MGPKAVQAGRYLDAVRHMRARQLVTRPRRVVPMRVLAAGTRPGGEVPFRPLAAGRFDPAAPQSGPQPPPTADGTFRAVGARRAFGSPGFWSDPRDGLLFLFTLHGFAELARHAAAAPAARDPAADGFWVRVLEDWLERCGEPAMPAWHPYPTSERLLAWAAALSAGGWPEPLGERMARSMLHQARVLARCVEHDIGGNHVLRNAAGLTVAGACLADDRLLARGLRLYARELPAQVLADGGHEERSPSYHRVLLEELEDVLAVLAAAGRPPPAAMTVARDSMTAWQAALTGPDGGLPLLNDAWEGPPLAVRNPSPSTDLAATGYVVLRAGGDQAVLDVAPLVPAHLPPHAHADALSFVLWADGAPLVGDPGAFAYTGPDRRAFRSTAAHATVAVDGEDQCDLWGDFRAAHLPASGAGRSSTIPAGVIVLRASHDGYRRLPDPVRHERSWCWLPGQGLVVVDRLRARRAHAVLTRLPLAPGVRPGEDGRAGPLRITGWGAGGGPARRVQTASAPYIGTRVPAVALERTLTAEPGRPFGWTLVRDPGAVGVLEEGDRVLVRRPGEPDLSL